MKHISIRVDQKLSDLLSRNAEQQGIKLTRYVRSLIEKGLVVDNQMAAGEGVSLPSTNTNYYQNSASPSFVHLMETMIECTLLIRFLVSETTGNEADYKVVLKDAVQRAKAYVSKQYPTQMDI